MKTKLIATCSLILVLLAMSPGTPMTVRAAVIGLLAGVALSRSVLALCA